MNGDVMFFIACIVLVFLVLIGLVGNIWLEDYFLFREFKKKELDPIQQEKLDELIQYIENSEEMRRIKELKQQIDELDKGDDD